MYLMFPLATLVMRPVVNENKGAMKLRVDFKQCNTGKGVYLYPSPYNKGCVYVFLFNKLFLITDDALQKKVNCTACGQQVYQFQRNSVLEHPVLKVLICKVVFSLVFHPCSSVQVFWHVQLPKVVSVSHSCKCLTCILIWGCHCV